MTDHIVELVRRADSAFVQAILRDGLGPSDFIDVEMSWRPAKVHLIQDLISHGVARNQWPQSLHWNWASKSPELELLHALGFGVICEDRWQGVMLTTTATDFARLSGDKGKPIVYVEYLEAAPWNWRIPVIGQESLYKGVGSLLFRQAVGQSLGEGFKGRVGLHSLPQSIDYYVEVCGMTLLGEDPSKQNLPYFEFTTDQAHHYLGLGDPQ